MGEDRRLQPMKIAFFLDLPWGLGGAGTLLLKQALLMSEVYNVVVVIPANNQGVPNQEYVKRCEQYHLPYVCIRYMSAFNFLKLEDFHGAMESADSIEEFARKEGITFFHSVQVNLAVEYVSRKLMIPHLMNSYQLREEEFKFCPGNIYTHYHLSDSLLYSDRWCRQLGMESRCSRPVALLDEIRKKKAYPQNGIRILMLGVVCNKKNQLTAIKAVEKCIGQFQIKLDIAGGLDGQYAEECKRYVAERGLGDVVTFHGFVSDITSLLESSDCLLCASDDESFPSSIVEAVTYDLTIISTPVAGVPEVFRDQENCFLSKDFSEAGISESIMKCLEYYKNGEIYRIHEKEQETWRKNFAPDVVREQIDAYYKDIVKNPVFGSMEPFAALAEEVRKTEELLAGIDDNGEKWIYGKTLYYSILRKHLSRGRIYIWGAGSRGKVSYAILRRICPELEIAAFIDSYKEGMYCGLPVIKADNAPIEENSFYGISFARGYDEVMLYLERRGLTYGRQILYIP